MDDKTALTYAITRALAYQENGGKPDLKNLKAGKTGEMKSIFQFTPDTWKKDAGTFLGNSNAPLTPDNETEVMTKQIGKWIDDGYTVKQMASMHNAGIGEPNAYSGKFSNGSPSVGVNEKYGVKFNVPQYADDVANYAKDFYTNDLSKEITPTQNQQTSPTQVSVNQPPKAQIQPQSGGGISGLVSPLMVSG